MTFFGKFLPVVLTGICDKINLIKRTMLLLMDDYFCHERTFYKFELAFDFHSHIQSPEAVVWVQCSHGKTEQPQCETARGGGVAVGAFTPASACATGIQRANGVKSATSMTYQFLRTESHRAPSALAWSLSAKGVTKFILMGTIIPACFHTPHGQVCRPWSLIEDKSPS